MVTILKEEDFFDGGLFCNLILPTRLPVPLEIMQHIYGEEIFKCDQFLPKSSQMGLLKYIWKIKGFEMEWCLCKQDHLVLLEEYNSVKRNFSVSQLQKKDFTQKDGLHYGRFNLSCTQAPLPSFVIQQLFCFMKEYYNSVPDGECFKSPQYHVNILKKLFGFFGKNPKVCLCSFGPHLIL